MNRIENATLLKDLTFGVEIEMSKIDKVIACNVVAKYYDTRESVDYEGGTYQKYTCKDSKGRKWAFENDGSSAGLAGSITCEMVTPILTYDDISDLQEIVRLLRKKGAKSGASYNSGVHIHIGGNKLTAKGIKNLINIVYKHEKLIYKAVQVSDARRNWCQPIDQKFKDKVDALKGDKLTRTAIENAWYETLAPYENRQAHYNKSRYRLMNLHSLFNGHGTVEFRCFEFKDSLHAGLLKSWIQLALAMVSYAQLVTRSNSNKKPMDNEKWEMRNWLLNMGLVDDEFKTARTLLIKNLKGDSASRIARSSMADLEA